MPRPQSATTRKFPKWTNQYSAHEQHLQQANNAGKTFSQTLLNRDMEVGMTATIGCRNGLYSHDRPNYRPRPQSAKLSSRCISCNAFLGRSYNTFCVECVSSMGAASRLNDFQQCEFAKRRESKKDKPGKARHVTQSPYKFKIRRERATRSRPKSSKSHRGLQTNRSNQVPQTRTHQSTNAYIVELPIQNNNQQETGWETGHFSCWSGNVLQSPTRARKLASCAKQGTGTADAKPAWEDTTSSIKLSGMRAKVTKLHNDDINSVMELVHCRNQQLSDWPVSVEPIDRVVDSDPPTEQNAIAADAHKQAVSQTVVLHHHIAFACIVIQSIARMFLCKQRYYKLHEQARRIQAIARGVQSRNRRILAILRKEQTMAIRIQRWMRSYVEFQQQSAAKTIQRIFRGYIKYKLRKKMVEAILLLQCRIRGRQTRTKVGFLNICVFTIQACWVRNRFKRKQVSARRIQLNIRGYLGRKRANRMKSRFLLEKPATIISSAWRGYLGRDYVRYLRSIRDKFETGWNGCETQHEETKSLQAGSSDHQKPPTNKQQSIKMEPPTNKQQSVKMEPPTNKQQRIKMEPPTNKQQRMKVKPPTNKQQSFTTKVSGTTSPFIRATWNMFLNLDWSLTKRLLTKVSAIHKEELRGIYLMNNLDIMNVAKSEGRCLPRSEFQQTMQMASRIDAVNGRDRVVVGCTYLRANPSFTNARDEVCFIHQIAIQKLLVEQQEPRNLGNEIELINTKLARVLASLALIHLHVVKDQRYANLLLARAFQLSPNDEVCKVLFTQQRRKTRISTLKSQQQTENVDEVLTCADFPEYLSLDGKCVKSLLFLANGKQYKNGVEYLRQHAWKVVENVKIAGDECTIVVFKRMYAVGPPDLLFYVGLRRKAETMYMICSRSQICEWVRYVDAMFLLHPKRIDILLAHLLKCLRVKVNEHGTQTVYFHFMQLPLVKSTVYITKGQHCLTLTVFWMYDKLEYFVFVPSLATTYRLMIDLETVKAICADLPISRQLRRFKEGSMRWRGRLLRSNAVLRVASVLEVMDVPSHHKVVRRATWLEMRVAPLNFKLRANRTLSVEVNLDYLSSARKAAHVGFAATEIQRIVRAYQAKAYAAWYRIYQSARKIQCIARIQLAQRRIVQLRLEYKYGCAATNVTRMIRGMQGREAAKQILHKVMGISHVPTNFSKLQPNEKHHPAGKHRHVDAKEWVILDENSNDTIKRQSKYPNPHGSYCTMWRKSKMELVQQRQEYKQRIRRKGHPIEDTNILLFYGAQFEFAGERLRGVPGIVDESKRNISYESSRVLKSSPHLQRLIALFLLLSPEGSTKLAFQLFKKASLADPKGFTSMHVFNTLVSRQYHRHPCSFWAVIIFSILSCVVYNDHVQAEIALRNLSSTVQDDALIESLPQRSNVDVPILELITSCTNEWVTGGSKLSRSSVVRNHALRIATETVQRWKRYDRACRTIQLELMCLVNQSARSRLACFDIWELVDVVAVSTLHYKRTVLCRGSQFAPFELMVLHACRVLTFSHNYLLALPLFQMTRRYIKYKRGKPCLALDLCQGVLQMTMDPYDETLFKQGCEWVRRSVVGVASKKKPTEFVYEPWNDIHGLEDVAYITNSCFLRATETHKRNLDYKSRSLCHLGMWQVFALRQPLVGLETLESSRKLGFPSKVLNRLLTFVEECIGSSFPLVGVNRLWKNAKAWSIPDTIHVMGRKSASNRILIWRAQLRIQRMQANSRQTGLAKQLEHEVVESNEREQIEIELQLMAREDVYMIQKQERVKELGLSTAELAQRRKLKKKQLKLQKKKLSRGKSIGKKLFGKSKTKLLPELSTTENIKPLAFEAPHKQSCAQLESPKSLLVKNRKFSKKLASISSQVKAGLTTTTTSINQHMGINTLGKLRDKFKKSSSRLLH